MIKKTSSSFVISEKAKDDLLVIEDYISSDNPNAARKVIQNIVKRFFNLAESPLIGHERKDLTDKPLRFLSVYSYLIIYNPNSEPLEIVRVISAYRNIPVILH